MLIRSTKPQPLTAAELLPPELAAGLDALDMQSRRVFAGKMQGERRSKRRGRSVEFDDFRPYVSGDDLRHIDWNVYARLDKFFIKLFQEEEDLSVHVVIDASPSMLAGEPSKLLCACRLGAALSYVALANNNRLYLSAFGIAGAPAGGLVRLEPMRGRTSVQRAVKFILDIASRPDATGAHEVGPGAFTDSLRALAGTRQGRGVMLLLTDLLVPPPSPTSPPGYEPGLKYLAGDEGGFQAYVLQVLSQGELDPAREGAEQSEVRGAFIGDLRLLDSETGRAAEITVTTELLKRYRRNLEQYLTDARQFCKARGIVHTLVPSDTDVPRFVLDTLRRLGVLA